MTKTMRAIDQVRLLFLWGSNPGLQNFSITAPY